MRRDNTYIYIEIYTYDTCTGDTHIHTHEVNTHDYIDTQITYTAAAERRHIQRLRILLDILFTAEIFC